MCLGRVMLRDHGLPHTCTVNTRARMLAFIQNFLLSSAHIPWMEPGALSAFQLSVRDAGNKSATKDLNSRQ